ncbi:MAG TPA: ATP-grasp domain-containing protein [Solirubrobacteraceae bacterium]|nr:ATP-grasp domain-containing protein [Solirubrobacteraceae bacterium]
MNASAPGAVVVGGDYQGLAIARSLGRRGVDVVVVDDELSISRFSRYVSRSVRVAGLREHRRTIETLLAIADRLGLDGWVLYPTREETVAAIARHREELVPRFRVPTPPWEVVRWAWDKRNTYARAAELGIPAPRTWTLSGLDDLASVDGEPPFVIKPAIKEHFLYATRRKAWSAATRAELETRVADAAELIGPAEVIVQELIPGPGAAQLAYCGFFKDGHAHARMTVRRRRQHPPDFGRSSTLAQTIEDPGLTEPSERFLRSIGYYGLVEVEYKYDERDGQAKLLDVNARTWGYHGLGARAGVDFPAHLYADQLGLPPPDRGLARTGVSWVRLATDVPTAGLELVRGALGWREYLASLRSVRVESVFAREDPLPGVAELALLPYLALKRGF